MCCFIRLYLIFLFSHSVHCHRWCAVMRELREVSLQRAFEKYSKEMLEKRKELERASLLRPSSLTAMIQLMHARSLWPSVMAELTLKFAYKSTECYEKVLDEEQENWMTDDDDDDDDDDAPAPIQRPPLQIRRRRGRRGKLLCYLSAIKFCFVSLIMCIFLLLNFALCH